MSLSRVIEVSFNGGSIAYVKADTAYFYNSGIIFKPTDIDLPASYQVHWADSPNEETSLETIGTSEGAPIPDDLWNRSRVIYGWIYLHPTEDSAVTAYEVRIYKNVRAGLPDGTEPTPAEQSTIDQLISALNTAVEQTGEDVESAEQAKNDAESARDNAQTYANNAQTSATQASTSASQASTSATASAQSASQSAQIKADVEDLVDDAQGYAQESELSATASANFASDSQGYAQSASASAQSASTSASSALTSANTANTKASEASISASTASTKATEASQSAENALSYKTDAESAKTASQTAQGLAESARDSAITAKNDAESARDDAVQAKTDVQNIADGIDTRLVDVESALIDKAPIITDTASGSIASFSDGADGLPLKSLVVDINPVQELHGQDAPYPAGGGVNQWDEEWEAGSINAQTGRPVSSNTQIRSINFCPCVPNTEYAKVHTPTNLINVFWYDENKDYISVGGGGGNNPYGVVTSPENARWFKVRTDNAYGGTYGNDISINYPSTDHDYHPYSNICPISGWTGANVQRTGKNLCDANNLASTPTPVGERHGVTISKAGTYTIHSDAVSMGNAYIYAYPVNADGTYGALKYIVAGTVRTATTITITDGVKLIVVDAVSTNSMAISKALFESWQIQIELGSTATAYEPYTGRSITITLGQTVYGGKLDVLSGVLTVDRANIASYNGETLPSTWISDRDVYASGTTPTTGAQVVYQLATPLEIQLTPNQVNSLLGVNNIWADSGDTEVVYRADTKLFIERLTAPDSADMIADANITSGQYFMVGNSLYKATANIANGSAIIVGTNCTRKSLSEALNEINA